MKRWRGGREGESTLVTGQVLQKRFWVCERSEFSPEGYQSSGLHRSAATPCCREETTRTVPARIVQTIGTSRQNSAPKLRAENEGGIPSPPPRAPVGGEEADPPPLLL
eukprot:767264-Pleurochrysis_carterae.AAC.1